MSDFEVHPIGTTEEIKLSRELSTQIEAILYDYGKVIPHNVYNAYMKLKDFYAKQIEAGML
jgi:hypothetical protein